MASSFRFSRLAYVLGVVALQLPTAACSARDAVPVRARPAPVAARAVVWTEDVHGEGERSYFLDAVGHVLEERKGVAVYDAGTLLTAERRDESVTTSDCGDAVKASAPNEAPLAAGLGVSTSLWLVSEAGDELRVLPAPRPDRPVQAFQSVIDLTGTAGPYLFLRQSTYVLTCGGMGSLAVESFVWDVTHHKLTPRAAMFPDDASLEGRAQRALLADAEDDERQRGSAAGEPQVTELLPTLARDGDLSLSVRFVAPTSYAGTRGGWSSNTRSVFVPAKTLPAALTGYAVAPEPVRTFVRAQNAPVRGYSTRP